MNILLTLRILTEKTIVNRIMKYRSIFGYYRDPEFFSNFLLLLPNETLIITVVNKYR